MSSAIVGIAKIETVRKLEAFFQEHIEFREFLLLLDLFYDGANSFQVRRLLRR